MDARLKQANEEYDNMKGHFANFSAIKESKTTRKRTAERECKLVEDKLNQQISVQKKLVEGIADLFNRAAEVQPESRAIASTDQVQANATLERMQAQLVEIKEGCDEAKRIAQSALSQVGQIAGCRAEVAGLKKSLDMSLKDVRHEIEHYKTTATALSVESLRVDKLLTDGAALVAEVAEMKTKLKLLSTFTIGNDGERVDTPIDGDSSISEQIRQMQQQHDTTDSRLMSIESAVLEEGKDTPVKRLKNLDRLVNNLSSQVQTDGKPPLQQRLSQLEHDYDTLEADVKAVKSSPEGRPGNTAATAADVQPLNADLARIQENLDSIEEQINESTTLIFGNIEERCASIETTVSTIEAARLRDANNINTTFDGVTTDLNNINANVAALQGKVTNIEGTGPQIAQIEEAQDKLQKLLDTKADIDSV